MPLSHDYLTFDLPYRDDSSGYFLAIRDLSWAIWLDSGEQDQHRGRFDILSANPSRRLISDQHGSRCELVATSHSAASTIHYDSAWQALAAELAPSCNAPVNADELPFRSGALGYLGYDLGRQLESFHDHLTDHTALPQLLMGIYQWAIVQDHLLKRTTLVCEATLGQDFANSLWQTLADSMASYHSTSDNAFRIDQLTSNTQQAEYEAKVARIQDYITAGDCYQVNFAQRYSARYQGDLLEAYIALRKTLPSPFSCFFETDYGTVLSLSPERFILSDGQQLLTQPIKGTAPRGKTLLEDQELAEQLRHSRKDQAENVMIVDLLRNDLSKVCLPHTVKTPKLFDLESYTNVHHLVSSVTGTLKPAITPVELLAACFPGGSITGAPKIRAMEVIEELENSRRSVYCGSMGYIDKSGKMDTNIAIRTIAANQQELFVWGGGGIVADSVPQQEYQESLTKIGVILETLQAVNSKRH